MRAVVVEKPGRITIESVEDPAPGPREVVLAIDGCGICGTDIHLIDGELPYRPYPVIPGHEFAGVVVGVGTEVTEFAEGDRVAADPNIFCGECHYCSIGRGNLCVNYHALGVTRDGACAEFLATPVANCYGLPEGVSLAHAPLIEPLSCAVHGFDLLPGRVGEHYLVYGAGTMGLIMAQLARRAGAATVSMVDLNDARLQVAADLGVDFTATDSSEFDRPQGWEVVVDCTGAIPAIEDAFTRVRPGGTLQIFGVAAADAMASFNPFKVYKDEVTVVGSMAVLHSFGRAVDLMAKGVIDADVMISHTYPIDRYSDAVEGFRGGIGRKLLVRPQHDIGGEGT